MFCESMISRTAFCSFSLISGRCVIPYASARNNVPNPCEYIGPCVDEAATAMKPDCDVFAITYTSALSICAPNGPRPGLDPDDMNANPQRLVTAILPRYAPLPKEPSELWLRPSHARPLAIALS